MTLPHQKNIFKHGPIDQEWILVSISLVIFVASTEIYKAIKRAVLQPPRKALLSTETYSAPDQDLEVIINA